VNNTVLKKNFLEF